MADSIFETMSDDEALERLSKNFQEADSFEQQIKKELELLQKEDKDRLKADAEKALDLIKKLKEECYE